MNYNPVKHCEICGAWFHNKETHNKLDCAKVLHKREESLKEELAQVQANLALALK